MLFAAALYGREYGSMVPKDDTAVLVLRTVSILASWTRWETWSKRYPNWRLTQGCIHLHLPHPSATVCTAAAATSQKNYYFPAGLSAVTCLARLFLALAVAEETRKKEKRKKKVQWQKTVEPLELGNPRTKGLISVSSVYGPEFISGT